MSPERKAELQVALRRAKEEIVKHDRTYASRKSILHAEYRKLVEEYKQYKK